MKNQKFNPKQFYFLLLAFCFLLTTGMQCKKSSETPKEVLPAETQTGKGTFGCLVNGEVWLPKGNFPYSGLTATIQFGGLNLMASKSNEGINIGIANIMDTKDYELNNKNAEYSIGSNFYKSINGKLTLKKYDKTMQIISGTFSFEIEDINGNTIKITDGRFDLKYTN